MTWRFLHIVCMVGAVAVGGDLFRNALLRAGDLQTIRRAFVVERQLGNWVFFPLFLAGGAFGVIAALTRGWNLAAPGCSSAMGWWRRSLSTASRTWSHTRRMAALAQSDDDASNSQLRALIRSPRTRLASGINAVLWLAVFFVMTFRPLGG